MVNRLAGSEKRVLLYFGHAPMEGAGSAIIVLRHLRRLAAHGWTIRVVSDWGQDVAVCEAEGWPVFHLSHRKAWWPPYHPDNRLLRFTRHWLWAGECHGFIEREPPDAVFTYLSAFTDFMSQVAMAYAERYDVPLSLIAHDDPAAFSKNPDEGVKLRGRYQEILERSHQNWFASPQLAAIYDLPQERRSTLPPIPEGYGAMPEWKREFAERPLIVYAGNFWPAQLPLFARLGREVASAGGRLMLLVKKTPDLELLCREEVVEWHEPFRENREALRFLAENAAGLLVCYAETSDCMPWIRTSFPSKLIEYTHLGLPLMILSPADSAVACWAAERNCPDHASTETAGAMAEFVESLKDEDTWQDKAAFARKFAETEFDPRRIHETFETSLTRS